MKYLFQLLFICLLFACKTQQKVSNNSSILEKVKNVQNGNNESPPMLFITFKWTQFNNESDSCYLEEIIQTNGDMPREQSQVADWQVVYCITKKNNTIDSIKAEHPLFKHVDTHHEDGHIHTAENTKQIGYYFFRIPYKATDIKSIKVFSKAKQKQMALKWYKEF